MNGITARLKNHNFLLMLKKVKPRGLLEPGSFLAENQPSILFYKTVSDINLNSQNP